MGTVKPSISDLISIEEAYFLLRTAMWDQEDFKGYIDLHENKGYELGYDDGQEYGESKVDNEAEFERGYDRGFKDGQNEGWQEGYDQGYDEASKDQDYRR